MGGGRGGCPQARGIRHIFLSPHNIEMKHEEAQLFGISNAGNEGGEKWSELVVVAPGFRKRRRSDAKHNSANRVACSREMGIFSIRSEYCLRLFFPPPQALRILCRYEPRRI